MIARVFPRKTNASPTDAADLIERLTAENAKAEAKRETENRRRNANGGDDR